jgi:hypothetical protein
MKDMPTIYKPKLEDIYHFENLSDTNLKQLCSLAENSLKTILDGIARCDTKASAQVPFLLTLYGAYGIWVKNYLSTEIFLKITFYVNTLLVLLILFLSFACLWVRVYATSPPISNVLEWLKDEPHETLDKRIIPTILFKIAQAEYENYSALKSKSHILKISQALIIINIGSLLFSILCSIT